MSGRMLPSSGNHHFLVFNRRRPGVDVPLFTALLTARAIHGTLILER